MTPPPNHNWRREVLDLVYAATRRKLAVVLILFAAAGLGLAAASAADPVYRATTTIVLLPREKPIFDLSVQSASVETAEDAAKRSASATLTLPPNPELYTTLIRSGEVTQRVARMLADDPAFAGRQVPTSGGIRAGLSVEATEEGVLKIVMLAGDPDVAAAIVNAVVSECETASKAIERQLIVQQTGFLDLAIEDAESRLEEARVRVAAFTDRFGVAEPAVAAARSGALIQTLDDTEARLARELERARLHRTDADPSVAALRTELAEVRARRAGVRMRYCGDLSETEYAAVECEWRSLDQDVTLRRDLLMSMRARHDVFRIRAEQPAGNIAVIRPASVPVAPSGPSRRKYLVLATLGGGLLACAYCVLAEQLSRVKQDAATSAQWASILASIRSVRQPKPAHGS